MSKYHKNGNSFSEESDFKRKHRPIREDANDDQAPTEHDGQVALTEKAADYARDCTAEKSELGTKYPIAARLLENELEKVYTSGRIPTKEYFANIYREKPMRVAQKILVPIREHPKFNFVGKILGPKGNSLRRLQEETLCKMVILGRNSMKDRAKEEELRQTCDPKYAHLHRDLHIEVSTIAPPSEAYARIAYALAELRKYLIPDANDEIRQEQLRELQGSHELEERPLRKATPYPVKTPYRPPPPPPTYPKTKPTSILEKARAPSYRHSYESYEHPSYAYSAYAHAPDAYEMSEYEPPEYRREFVPKSSATVRSSSYRPPPSHYSTVPPRRPEESTSRSRETVRYRTAPYLKPK